MRKVYYKGTIIQVSIRNYEENRPMTFILALYDDKDRADFVFRLICIVGYKAGHEYGLIRVDPYCETKGLRGVTKSHLIKEFKRPEVLGDILLSTLKILPKLETI